MRLFVCLLALVLWTVVDVAVVALIIICKLFVFEGNYE